MSQKEGPSSFLDAIGRSDLSGLITSTSPWTYFTMEVGLPYLSFAGGLGILAGDLVLRLQQSSLPFVCVTLLYPWKWKQKIENFSLTEEYYPVYPAIHFKRQGKVYINANQDTVQLEVFTKDIGSVKLVALYEPGLRELYWGDSNSDHRLYQETVLGFGGRAALVQLGLDPSLIHLNEAPCVFAALSYLDSLCQNGMDLKYAIQKTRAKTILTNHTILPGATPAFSTDQFSRFVFSNIKSKDILNWLLSLISSAGGTINLTGLSLELAGRANGVSKLHSSIASKLFTDLHGKSATFTPITNGISLRRWTNRGLFSLYRTYTMLSEQDLPTVSFREQIDKIASVHLREQKQIAKEDLTAYLNTHTNQYKEPIVIPIQGKIAVWARRLADYKRPFMIFDDLVRLSRIMSEHNMYLILCGNATGLEMKEQLKYTLNAVSQNESLRGRVFFLHSYDEVLADHLLWGSDIWLNTPEVGKEACGTSWMKSVVNLCLLISTRDGGVADVSDDSYFQITGASYTEEIESLYNCLSETGKLLNDVGKWGRRVKDQIKSFLSVASSARMLSDYINFAFPKVVDKKVEEC